METETTQDLHDKVKIVFERKTTTCDSCGRKGYHKIFYSRGAPVLAQCGECETQKFHS